MPADTEQDMLEEFVSNGSEQAFERLVGAHISMVLGCALRRTRDPGMAEEIAQDVFAILARKAHCLKAGAGLAGWLHKTTLYEIQKALRGRTRRERKMKALAEHTKIEDSTANPINDIGPIVDEAIDSLPNGDRQLVLLHFLEGQTFAEISQALGKTEGACQRQASRAMAKLRAILGSRGAVAGTTSLATLLASESAKAAAPGLVSSISSGAVASASTLTKTSLVANAIETMTYAKTKIAVLVAAAAAVPLGVQIKTNGNLKEELYVYEQREADFVWQTERLAQYEKVITQLPGGAETIANLGGNDRPIAAARPDGDTSTAVAKRASLSALTSGKATKPAGASAREGDLGDENPRAVAADLSEIDDMMANPVMREMIMQQMEAQIELTYGALFDHLGLDVEKREMVAKVMLDNSMDLASELDPKELSIPEKMDQLAAEEGVRDAKLTELLGEEGFKVLERYEESEDERQELATFRASLEEQRQEISFELEQKLMAIMHEENNAPAGGLTELPAIPLAEQLEQIYNGEISPQAAAAFIEGERETQARILARTAELLTPEQLTLFKRNQEAHLEIYRTVFSEMESK